MNELLDHAARVLEHQPTRSMEADILHRRAERESGAAMQYEAFLDAIRQSPDRFAVVAPDPTAGAASMWDPRHRSLYEAALHAAGLTVPLVVLTTAPPPRDSLDLPLLPATPQDVLRDVQDTLTHLLHASRSDESLRGAVLLAVDELHCVQRAVQR